MSTPLLAGAAPAAASIPLLAMRLGATAAVSIPLLAVRLGAAAASIPLLLLLLAGAASACQPPPAPRCCLPWRRERCGQGEALGESSSVER